MTKKDSNIYKVMQDLEIDHYDDFWRWSVCNKELFWEQTVANLGIVFEKKYDTIVDVSRGVENAQWLDGSKLNIVDSCFQNSDDAIAVVYQDNFDDLKKVTQLELEHLVNKIANGLVEHGLKAKDTIAIYMPMTLEAVAIYLAAIKAGVIVATIADSFSAEEIEVRLKITNPRLVFTQDGFMRGERIHLLYDKCIAAKSKKNIVINTMSNPIPIANSDVSFEDFLSSNTKFDSVKVLANDVITILFSSGTTGEPKAIPWDHTTPIKSASDAYYHHDIQPRNIVCWPTNLGWMMGPWLVFASLINKATLALPNGSPTEVSFGKFVQEAKVTMLGIVPSLVKSWKKSTAMELFDWNAIRCFSSTGEVSNLTEMEYLMELGGGKPVIEYCGGTEIGGGYVASTLIQKNNASQFSTQTLGGEFVLLDENGKENSKGEVFLIPPIMGLSTHLLNRDHHEVYYKDVPSFKGKVLRKHGDELIRLESGYYKANGRIDDTMNLGGIKISSVQIESVLNELNFINESAAIAISPKEGGASELVLFFVAEYTIDKKQALKKVQNCIKSKLNPLFKVVDLVKIDNLPRTASKKIKRKELRKIYQNL